MGEETRTETRNSGKFVRCEEEKEEGEEARGTEIECTRECTIDQQAEGDRAGEIERERKREIGF